MIWPEAPDAAVALFGAGNADLASREELERLQLLFSAEAPVKRRPPPAQPQLKMSFKRVMNQMDLRRMYFCRYGTEGPAGPVVMSYLQVARKLYLPISTVYYGLKRYEQDGLKFVDRRKTNFCKTWKKQIKLKGALKDYLLSYEVLTDWAPYNLEQRAKLIAALGV